MEDFKNAEDGQSPTGSQKDKQIIKESTTPAALNCVTLRCSSTPSLSPVGPTLPPAGEISAKQSAVVNGAVSSAASLWPMSREVPPRFRNHQEPKILLKRGQSLDGISPFLHTGDQSHVDTSLRSDPNVDLTSSPSVLSLSSLTYANSTCGPGPGAPPLSQGMAPNVTDGSDLQAWPSTVENRMQKENVHKSSWECKQKNNPDPVEPGVTADGDNCEVIPSSPCEAAGAVNMQQIQRQAEGQSVEEAGPKQVEAVTHCREVNHAVQLPALTGNLEALIPAACRTAHRDVVEPGGMWGTSAENGVGCRVRHQVVQAETGNALQKQAAPGIQSDVPKEGSSEHVKKCPPDCLQVIATKTLRIDGEKGVKESGLRESAADGSSEDGTDNNSRSQSSCSDVTLQSMLSQSHLDPRVLSNTGWGQIQIKQSIAWDLEVDSRSESGPDWTEQAHGEWSRDSQGHVKGSRIHGAGNTWEQSEERTESKLGVTGRDSGCAEGVKDDGNRKDQDRGSWGPGTPQWGQNKGRAGPGERTWTGNEEQSKHQQVRGDHRHLQHTPNNHMTLQNPNPPRSSHESRDPPTDHSSGWKPAHIPHTSAATEPNGWEEPSPQSISRKMEIDDGTSAWGDPAHYDHRSVNMWDKSNLQQKSEPSQHHQESMSAPTVTSRENNAAWERSAGAPEHFMNSSKAGWGKAFEAPSNWRDSEESGKGTVWSSSRSNAGSKTGSKTMQDGWSEEGVKTSRHSSWEEDSTSAMWSNRSQEHTSSFSSAGWSQGQSGRRTGGKVPVRGNGSWTDSLPRQMSNMTITDEEVLTTSDRNRRGMNDYNGEMRRGGRGGGNFRSHGSKEPPTTGLFNTHLRGVQQQQGVHHINPSPGVRAQVPQQFLPPQVSGSVVNAMFSPQHVAVLGGVPPHMQQVQLAYQLLLQQQQHHFLSHRKFPHHLSSPPPPPPHPPHPPLLQHQDPQQLARIMAVLQQLPKSSAPFPGFVPGAEPESVIGGVKEVGGAQPQFKWMMDAGHPLCPSPESIMFKNGLLPGQNKLGGDSSYTHYDLVGVENVGVASPGLTDGWSRIPGGKLGSAPNAPTWPPEFQPGVPWKGVQSPEPDLNPYSGMLGENTLTDTEHHLLQDNTEMNTVLPSPGAWPYCASDTHTSATSWPPEPIGHRTNRNISQMPRPPPGLSHQKQPPWLGAGPHLPRGWSSEMQNQEAPFVPESSWSGGSSTGSSWLLLSNLTPQIDSSTLKTICLQHGPLVTFNLGVAQGSALIRYCSVDEAAKAQSALHMCVLGNTTILAEFVSEEDVTRYFTHSHSGETDRQTESETGGGREMKLGWENLDRDGLSLFNRWSQGREGGVWGGVAPGYQASNLWGSPQVEDRGPALFPGLGGGADAL